MKDVPVALGRGVEAAGGADCAHAAAAQAQVNVGWVVNASPNWSMPSLPNCQRASREARRQIKDPLYSFPPIKARCRPGDNSEPNPGQSRNPPDHGHPNYPKQLNVRLSASIPQSCRSFLSLPIYAAVSLCSFGGGDLLGRYGERPEVIHAALGHHDDLRLENPYTVLVAAADACSASRPGARRETLERYIKRMEELESIANKFTGVEQAYAIQAGREMRVIVSAKETTDETAAKICHDIVAAFEQQLTYPGEIKVTVLRETRHVEMAR